MTPFVLFDRPTRLPTLLSRSHASARRDWHCRSCPIRLSFAAKWVGIGRVARKASAANSRWNDPGKDAVRIGQIIARIGVAGALVLPAGCAHSPWYTRKMRQGAPLAQARAIGLASRAPDSRVLPELVGQLNNSDPVVRLAAHEELRRRTGQDFGYVPWAPPEERSGAIERWQAWVGQDRLSTAQALKSPGSPALPGKSLPGAATMIPTT